ncbi:MAG: hypothetical protein ACFFAS_16445 [Promethearchaeota archaeon]
MKSVKELFEGMLSEKGIRIISQNEKTYLLENKGLELQVNIENIEKNYIRDKEPEIVSFFVNQIFNVQEVPKDWKDVASRVYFSLEPWYYDFGDTIYDNITEFTCIVAVYVHENESRISWITNDILNSWNVDMKELKDTAKINMVNLLNTIYK